jgi:hypothetical protein
VTGLHREIPEITAREFKPLLLYTLGKPIIPNHEVKAGRIYRASRVWAMLDLLLTCRSISEAVAKTKGRHNAG